jgi:hypothetical protein
LFFFAGNWGSDWSLWDGEKALLFFIYVYLFFGFVLMTGPLVKLRPQVSNICFFFWLFRVRLQEQIEPAFPMFDVVMWLFCFFLYYVIDPCLLVFIPSCPIKTSAGPVNLLLTSLNPVSNPFGIRKRRDQPATQVNARKNTLVWEAREAPEVIPCSLKPVQIRCELQIVCFFVCATKPHVFKASKSL